ncbi:MAG: carbohydrate kinase [Clostridia bacterium]|nr:carbohydrate kinase [Clostridia bacterium]
MKKFDVIALGELLIDFIEHGTSSQGNPVFEANPGGAPCNVLAMLNKLGKKTAFIGKVGNDAFGHMLKNVVEDIGTDVTNLFMDNDIHTTLAFVSKLPNGDRDFSFYRNPGADMMLAKNEIDENFIKDAKIFHFGTLSSTHNSVREATRYAVELAKKHNLLISFDPNMREPLWPSLQAAKNEIEYGLSKCDILKISDNELEFMTGTDDHDKAARMLKDKYDISIVFATLGKGGSRAYYKDISLNADAFLQSETIETTGAGDTFTGCILNFILEHGIDNLNDKIIHEALVFANAAASIITTKKGALKVMPEKREIAELISKYI